MQKICKLRLFYVFFFPALYISQYRLLFQAHCAYEISRWHADELALVN